MSRTPEPDALERAFRRLRNHETGVNLTARAVGLRAEGLRRREHAPRPRAYLWSVALAGVADSLAMVFGAPGFHQNDKALADAAHEPGARASSPARAGVSGSLLLVGSDPTRLFQTGEVLPLGVVLGAPLDREGHIVLSPNADAFLQPGSQVVLEAADAIAAVTLERGFMRLDVRASPAHARAHVRVADALVDLSASEARFSVMVAAGRRWSAAVERGEIHLEPPSPGRRIVSGEIAGAPESGPVVVRPLPQTLDLDAHARRDGEHWIVEGLSDVLARVRVDDREVVPDAHGRFRVALQAVDENISVVAFDVASRTAARLLHVASPSPRPSAPEKPAQADRPPNRSPTDPGAVRSGARNAVRLEPKSATSSMPPRSAPPGEPKDEGPVRARPIDW